ncbi:helix-turn-helix transcriptional regulator [Pseudoalteromonas luteoviolacea]|uniref:helix-turn-helix transcriptional regulator n=1 Tax=Pseudoalteromonas luteoviolacea TaxID=43657 RepID=UPI001F2FF78E|nr:helix-turn-helix transcriptional regulator [Pseudoalteromonas luteoviolacea]MCF6442533.1 helix-turn-helix transcriptional regulator [Pseudoalteromonas luteoviolacea]
MSIISRNERSRRAQTQDAKRYIQMTIRRMRQDMNLTQAQLGKSLVTPVDQATISNWESGKTELSASQLLDVMMLFGKPNFLMLLEQCDVQSNTFEDKRSA